MRLDQLRRKTKRIGKLKLEDRNYVQNKRQENGHPVRVNADGNYDYDFEGIDDDRETDVVSKRKEEEQNRVVTKELQQISIPQGILCSECAKIGTYDLNSNVPKGNTKLAGDDRTSDSRERCSICQTLGTSSEDHIDTVKMSVLYSHEFYDKYSREKRPGNLTDSGDSSTRENSTVKDKNSDRLQREKSIDRTEPKKSSRRPFANSVRIPGAQQEKGEHVVIGNMQRENAIFEGKENLTTKHDSGNLSQTDDKCNNKAMNNSRNRDSKSGTSLPEIVSKISLVDPNENKSLDILRRKFSDDRSLAHESLASSGQNSKKDQDSSEKPRSFILAATRRNADRFSSMYMKRAMKGSTVRKDLMNKYGDSEHHQHREKYTVESLGLTFGIPEFNLRLAGRTVNKSSVSPRRPNSHRSTQSSNSQSFFPPIKSAKRHSFSLQGF